MLAEVDTNGVVSTDGMVLSQNMNPGQVSTNFSNNTFTFVGFETLNLAGKIFSNTCHFKAADSQGTQTEGWYAPGYGMIKNNGVNGVTWQYNGDL